MQGWCGSDDNDQDLSLRDCLGRSQTYLGTGIRSEDFIGYGILSSNQNYNPHFMITPWWFQIIAMELHIKNGKQIWFRGQANTLESFFYAKDNLGMNKAKEILLIGSSAGGVALLNYVDYFREILEQDGAQKNIKAICDSGIFLNQRSYESQQFTYGQMMENNFNLSHSSLSQLNNCKKQEKEKWKCELGETMLNYVQTPTLLIGSESDTWSIQNILEIQCIEDYIGFEKCSEQELEILQNYKQKQIQFLKNMQKNNKNISVWNSKKPFHVLITGNSFNDHTWIVPYEENGKTAEMAILSFLKGERVSLYDKIEHVKVRDFDAENNLFQEDIQFKVDNSYKLHLIQDPEAKCLDGSPYSLYFKKGNPKKFILFFVGGGWCRDVSDDIHQTYKNCLGRSHGRNGSSKVLKREIHLNGILSPDKDENPDFYDYSVVRLNYCDGAGYQGSRKDPIIIDNKKIWFRGKQNALSGLKYALDNLNMKQADEVIISGESAGGMATLTWLDHFKEQINQRNPNTKVVGVSDSSMFFDELNMYTNTLVYSKELRNTLSIANKETQFISEECVRDNANDPFKCMFAETLLQYVKTPLLITQSLYDTWMAKKIVGVSCFYFQIMGGCTEDEQQQLSQYRERVLKFVDQTVKQQENDVPIMDQYKKKEVYTSKDWCVPKFSDYTFNEAIREFIRGKRIVQIDQEKWPDNIACAYNLNFFSIVGFIISLRHRPIMLILTLVLLCVLSVWCYRRKKMLNSEQKKLIQSQPSHQMVRTQSTEHEKDESSIEQI